MTSNLHLFGGLIALLEKIPGKNDKVSTIRTSLTKNPGLAYYFNQALSPYVTFGIAKIVEVYGAQPQLEVGDGAYLDLYVHDLLEKLATRQLTGNDARLEVWASLQAMHTDQEKIALERILLKDLRCGVDSSVNKAVPGTVEEFSCQLAPSKMPEVNQLTYPVMVEPKLDGVRTIAIKDAKGNLKLLSRNGKELENFAEIERALVKLPPDTVLDGEVIAPSGFAALMSRAKAKRGKHDDVPIEYHVFDGMSAQEWATQSCQLYLRTRQGFISNALTFTGIEVQQVPSKMVTTPAEVERVYQDFVNQGYEGVMLKDPGGKYTFKRNATWQKLKPFDTVDLQVVDLIEGTGKYVGMLGAIKANGDHDGKSIWTEIGSGFTDQQRQAIWAQRPMGEWIEVRYQELSLAQDSKTWSLRFPTFVRFRDSKV